MLIDFENAEIYIQPGSTDLRKQINGLSIIVQEEMEKDPFSKAIFLFCNKNRKLLKIIYWDRNGFCLWQKRLEKDKFPWPKDREEALSISLAEFKLLLNGIDFFKAHKKLSYSKVN